MKVAFVEFLHPVRVPVKKDGGYPEQVVKMLVAARLARFVSVEESLKRKKKR